MINKNVFPDNTSAIIWAILAYPIPLMLILLIFCCGKSGRNQQINAPSQSITIEENEKQDVITIMVVIVIAIYFALWLPAYLLGMKRALFPETIASTEKFSKRYELYNK